MICCNRWKHEFCSPPENPGSFNALKIDWIIQQDNNPQVEHTSLDFILMEMPFILGNPPMWLNSNYSAKESGLNSSTVISKTHCHLSRVNQLLGLWGDYIFTQIQLGLNSFP